jgi:hypothetical protein
MFFTRKGTEVQAQRLARMVKSRKDAETQSLGNCCFTRRGGQGYVTQRHRGASAEMRRLDDIVARKDTEVQAQRLARIVKSRKGAETQSLDDCCFTRRGGQGYVTQRRRDAEIG